MDTLETTSLCPDYRGCPQLAVSIFQGSTVVHEKSPFEDMQTDFGNGCISGYFNTE